MTARTSSATGSTPGHRFRRLRSTWPRTAADVLRVVGAASFGWAVLDSQWVNAALFALVWGGLMLPRIPIRALAISPAADLVLGVVVLFAAWSAVLDLYLRYEGLDLVVHAVASGLIAVQAHRALTRQSPPGRSLDHSARPARFATMLTVASLGCALGLLWEVGEWVGHTYLDERIQVGYNDTMGDLVADGLGALVAGALLASRSRAGAR
jgi:hypothetical protein